jgi:hypothetical protein
MAMGGEEWLAMTQCGRGGVPFSAEDSGEGLS